MRQLGLVIAETDGHKVDTSDGGWKKICPTEVRSHTSLSTNSSSTVPVPSLRGGYYTGHRIAGLGEV